MVGGGDAIGVRTKSDKTEEEHDRKLMERIMQKNLNPFQRALDPLLDRAAYVYDTYLYSSGVLFIMLSFWSFYPSFVRFRHQHLFRYRRTQLTFRRGFFATPHMPKWDKKYLQRLVVPPLPTPVLTFENVAGHEAATVAAGGAAAAAATKATEVPAAVAVVKPAEGDLALHDPHADPIYQAKAMVATKSAHASFNADDAAKSERALTRELQKINDDFFGDKANLFKSNIRADAEDLDLQARLKEAVKSARAVVVLTEDHSSVASIPEGWEVWWVSYAEAQRRRFCRFWLGGLLCARAFQDLMDMPDMPDMIN